MMSSRHTKSVPDVSFWDRYLKVVHHYGNQAPFDRWYVKRAEDYIASNKTKALKEHTSADVVAYLCKLGRSGVLKDWQFNQAVTALEYLFKDMLRRPWSIDFDWTYWKDSARSPLDPMNITSTEGSNDKAPS
jgi:hypothetical protein